MCADLFEGYARNVDFIQVTCSPVACSSRQNPFGLEKTKRDFGRDYAESSRPDDVRASMRPKREGRLTAGFDRRSCDLLGFYLMC